MMLGEMDYSDILTSNVVGDVKVPGTNFPYVPLPELSYFMFVLFVLAVSIVLMNLLVSDICVNGTRYTDGIIFIHKGRYSAILGKIPWDSDAAFIIFCNFWVPF